MKNKLFFWKDSIVYTNKQIARFYGCEVGSLVNSFNKNKKRFKEEQDFYRLVGKQVRQFIEDNNWNDEGIDVSEDANVLHVWRHSGISKFSFILNTPVAWEVLDKLVDAVDFFGILSRKVRVAEKVKDQLYVILFDNGVIKVGRSKNAVKRVMQHDDTARAFGRRIVKWHIEKEPDMLELDLIKFCGQHGEVFNGNEYFKDLDYQLVLDYVKRKKIQRKVLKLRQN